MSKILAICCSDVLGVPALMRLQQYNMLAAVACTDKTAYYLVPIFKSLGIGDNDIHILKKNTLQTQLTQLVSQYQPKAIFTFTFSWMIPSDVLALLPNRCINFHFGLLPKYKGADPIFWQLKNGEARSGITIHIMTDEIDAGPVILIEEIPANPGETYGLNGQRLGSLGAEAVTKVIGLLNADNLPLITLPAQEDLFLKKPSPADLLINWQQQSAAQIENLVNAANPRYGGAVTSIRQMEVRILEVTPINVNNPSPAVPGTIVHADATYGIIVACLNQHYLKINVVSIREGCISGIKLFALGCQAGEVFI